MTMHKINELKLSGPGDGRLYLRFDEDERPEFHDMVDLCADALWLMAHPEERSAAAE